MALDDARAALSVALNDFRQCLRIESHGKRGRVNQIAQHHGQLATLQWALLVHDRNTRRPPPFTGIDENGSPSAWPRCGSSIAGGRRNAQSYLEMIIRVLDLARFDAGTDKLEVKSCEQRGQGRLQKKSHQELAGARLSPAAEGIERRRSVEDCP